MKHLIDIKDLSAENLIELFELADQCQQQDLRHKLSGHSAMALFFEHSTRTLTSFQLACQRLGMQINSLNIAHSSTQKGESLRDTILTLNAMGPDVFIVRHAENHIQSQISEWIDCPVINAGDGNNQHPTQALLDLYTIRKHKTGFEHLKVAIIGDIKHSRVANSLIDGLKILGCDHINLSGPGDFIPANLNDIYSPCIDAAIDQADVVVMLRIQTERLPEQLLKQIDDWNQTYGLTSERLKHAKPDAIVMHPGPMNRGVEIDSEVADGPQSVILEQVTHGVLLRQAALLKLLT